MYVFKPGHPEPQKVKLVQIPKPPQPRPKKKEVLQFESVDENYFWDKCVHAVLSTLDPHSEADLKEIARIADLAVDLRRKRQIRMKGDNPNL